MNIALITAGGVGSRMNQSVPKQFLTVYNKPIIIYTLEAFEQHPMIDAIIVSCLAGWEPILEAYAKQYNISKLKWIVNGGNNGQESIKNSIDLLKEEIPKDSIVIIHDGNRSLVSSDIISDSIVKCKEFGNGVAVVACPEVIVETTDNETSNKFFIRENLRKTQTPHTFYLKDLIWAHDQAKEKNITSSAATCDLMITLGRTLYFSLGSEKNLKITTLDDIEIFKAIISSEKETNDGFRRNCDE